MTTATTQISGVGSGAIDFADAVIRTEGLTRRFGGRVAVDGVELRVPRGACYGLIGLNGAGKSTLLRLVVGLLGPSAGRVMIGSADIALEPVAFRRRVGYVPDRPTAYGWMRVGEVLDFARKLRPEWDQARAKEMLERYRLDVKQKVGKLSKGTGAKLSLLLAMAHDPEILVLDEPTDGLDPVARDEFLEEVIGSTAERERTVLISSHALTDVQKMADVIGLLHKGKLAVQCSTDDLVRTTKRLRTVVEDRRSPAAPAGALCSRRVGREWIVTVRGFTAEMAAAVGEAAGGAPVTVEDVGLEDVFKDFVCGLEVGR